MFPNLLGFKSRLTKKILYYCPGYNFLVQKNCTAHHKNIICAAKIAISTFSHTLGILLSFWHTFKYFGILSQLLAHCADLSKSKGQLCCCHEAGLKPVLLSLKNSPSPGKKASQVPVPGCVPSVEKH